MSSTLQQPETETRPPETEHASQPAVLVDRLPDVVKCPRVVVGFVLCLGLTFWLASHQPLYHTDLWGHMAYGRLIYDAHALPATEPFMPLARGVPLVDTAWLSQLLGYAAWAKWGPTAIQFLHAAVITACLLLLSWRFYKRTKNLVLVWAGVGAFMALNWQQFTIVRPQMAGMLCFVALLTVLTGRRWRAVNWLFVPALFALWVNLHGSFLVGLGLLGCALTGRAIDVLRRTHSWSAAWHDTGLRRLLLLTQLAVAACLLNPYGWTLFHEVLTFSKNPNLADLIEWDPLQIRTRQGQVAAVVALGLMFAYRLSPRRVSSIEVVALLVFGAAALWSSRMLIWWSPLAAIALVWNAHAAWQHARRRACLVEPAPRTSRSTVIAVGMAWIFFAYTPFGLRLLHGREPELSKTVSAGTPLGAVEHLKKHPPKGQIFNTYEWGDYLVWAGPRDMEVFLTSHAHLIPREVWRHYISVIHVASDWQDTLDRYGVNTIVLDKSERGALIGRLKTDDNWKRTYEDSVAVVYVRRQPI